MAPAAKRRRKIVDSSDDEADRPQGNLLTRFLNSSPNPKGGASAASSRAATGSPSPLKKGPRALSSRNSANLSPSASPEKPRARGQKRVKIEDKGKSADLLTLFSKQAQKSQSSSTQPKATPIDDIDPISDDDESYFQAQSGSIVGQKAKKRLRDDSQAGASSAMPNPSQLFVKPTQPARPGAVDDDLRPWSERFGPVNLEELAVHKKKVADVRRWIEGVTRGRLRQRVLLLKGAAGTGKTTTVRLLARDLGCELLEWRSPAGNFVPGMQSPSAQFEAFLGLGGKFGGLDIDSDASENQKNENEATPAAQRIILVEEFPNTFTRSSTALASFRNAISAYIGENTPSLAEFSQKPPAKPITPIILVVSETLLTTTSASADSFTAHRLLGPEILRHPGAGVIEFNAIAPSLLSKALELVVTKEARKSGRRRTPGPQVLKRLGEIGDIRSAISSLEFLCLKGDRDGDWGARVSFTKPKKGGKSGTALTQGETESLEQVSQREASLGIFHAVGKVVYNKRDDAPADADDSVEVLPNYLKDCERPKRSQVSVDTLIDETGSDTSTFISALHENYVLSCEAANPADPTPPIDHVNGCIDALSDSDLLCPSWDVFFGGRGAPGGYAGREAGSHVVRQDELGFQVAVRGLLFGLPHPVKRVAAAPGRGADAFKMFYPTSIKLWRAKEEMEGLVDLWSTRLLGGADKAQDSVADGASLFLRAAKNNASLPPKASSRAPAREEAAPLLSLGSAARRELVLDRLPYMAHMSRRRALPLRARDLERVVSFGGLGAGLADEEEPEQGEEATGSEWATDRPYEGRSPRKKGGIRVRGGDGVVGGVEKLVLSDDDIED